MYSIFSVVSLVESILFPMIFFVLVIPDLTPIWIRNKWKITKVLNYSSLVFGFCDNNRITSFPIVKHLVTRLPNNEELGFGILENDKFAGYLKLSEYISKMMHDR